LYESVQSDANWGRTYLTSVKQQMRNTSPAATALSTAARTSLAVIAIGDNALSHSVWVLLL